MDAIAGLTGDMLGEIYAWRDDDYSDELRYLGYHIGKFIYLMDAYSDLEKDSKNKDYNPFITMEMESPKGHGNHQPAHLKQPDLGMPQIL